MQPLSVDMRFMIHHVLDSAQGTRPKGDGKATYTPKTVPVQIYFRPSETRVENTQYGLVKTKYVPAVCYVPIEPGDCLGTTTEKREYKVIAVNEIPMSGGQRQLELKKL